MKQGSFKTFWLILMAVAAVSLAFGDENTIQLESIVLDSFDGDSGYTWKIQGSKFATNNEDGQFPKITYAATWPTQIFGQNEEGKELKSLGIWAKFDRRGYNWIDIYPTGGNTEEGGGGEDADAPAEIPMPGRSQIIDIWVWGSNLNCLLEAYVRDYRGVIHVLPMGSLHYTGWKNIKVSIPKTVPQAKRILPRLTGLTFVKFRIWTAPMELVNNFYIYFDQLKLLTDTFETHYDGEELADPKKIQEFWSGGDTN
jgi:hypothetical protein